LHQATFAVPCGNLTVENEYKLLLNAAAIRMEKKNKYGRWIPDDIIYPLKNASKTNVGQKSKVFKSFHPCRKLRFEDIRPVPYGSQPAAKEVSSSAEAQETTSEAGDMESAVLEQGTKNCNGAPGPELYGGEELPIYRQSSTSDRQAHTSTVKEEGSVQLGQRSRFVETLIQNFSQESIRDSHRIDWVEGIENAAPSESEMDDFYQDEPLISFDESSNEPQRDGETFDAVEPNSVDDELRRLHKGIMQLHQFEQSDDLIMLDNDPESPRANILQNSDNDLANTCLLSSEIPRIENVLSPMLDKDATGLDESNPLEARETNVFSDSLVRFGLMEERPRELYRTMNQRSGRPNSKATKAPRSPEKSHVATVGERSTTRVPAKGGSNPVVSLY
jgi:hypothetical protein